MVTICKECEFAGKVKIGTHKPELTGSCLSIDAPVTDYVSGFKACKLINDGKCKFYGGLAKPLED